MTAVTVCINGSHRGGTSLVARVVNLLGVDLGREDQLMAPRPDNPSGFWESGPITALNDDLLDHLGGRWDHPPVLEDAWATGSAFDRWRERAHDVLTSAFGDAPIRGWKDPRMSILLPFWRTVTEITSTVTVLRSPHDSAASLRTRNGMSAEEIEHLWVRYMVAALHAAPDALIVRYDDFFDDLPGMTDTLVEFLGVNPPEDARDRIEEFVDPSLRHHRSSASEVEMPLADFVFDALATGRGPIVADALHRLTHVRGTEAVRLMTHRDELLEERDRAMSMVAAAHDRLGVQDEALGRFEAEIRLLGIELEARDDALQDARAQITELQRQAESRWRRLGGRARARSTRGDS